MEKLQAFFNKLNGHLPSVSLTVVGVAWLGDVSGVRQSHRLAEICRRAGLSIPDDAQLNFKKIDTGATAKALSYVLKESLCYGERRYRAAQVSDFTEMFAELGESAQFWSNQSFEDLGPKGSINSDGFYSCYGERLTDATMETGVIGFNDNWGFIFWRGEED